MTGWLPAASGKNLLMLSTTGFSWRRFSAARRRTRLARGVPHVSGATGGALHRLRRRCCSSPSSLRSADGRWASGDSDCRRPDPRSGRRRLADRELQLAGSLHQSSGGDRRVVMTRLFVFDRRTCVAKRRDATGHGHAGRGHRALQFARQGQQEDWFASTMITTLAIVLRWRSSRSSSTSCGRFTHRGLRLFKDRSYRRRVSDDAARLRLYGGLVLCRSCCNAVRLLVAGGGPGDGPTRERIALHMPLVGVLTASSSRKLLIGGLVIGRGTMLWLET